MLSFLLAFLALGTLTLAFVFRQGVMFIISGVMWALFGAQSYTTSTYPGGGAMDVYYLLFVMSSVMALAWFLWPLALRAKKENEEEDDATANVADDLEEEWGKTYGATRVPRLRRYQRRRRAHASSNDREEED